MIQAIELGKVAVLYGGNSSEREISLIGGRAVHAALCAAGIDAHLLDTGDPNRIWTLKDEHFSRAFVMLHGRGGEDGEIQAILQWLGIPYTGSRVLACALAMDKVVCKKVWQSAGLPVLADVLVTPESRFETLVEQLHCQDVVIKPALEGSSVGVSRVKNQEQLAAAIPFAGGARAKTMAEPWIVGRELTYGIVNDTVLPAIEIVAGNDHDFYDYDAKYHAANTQYLCPAPIDAALDARCREIAFAAFQAIGARGWGRVDMIVDAQNRPYLLEINLVPGMTTHSLVPMAAQQIGMDFSALVQSILAQTLTS